MNSLINLVKIFGMFILASIFIVFPVKADMVVMAYDFGQNDCAVYFTGYSDDAHGFESCQIFHYSDTSLLLSPVLAGWNVSDNDGAPKTASWDLRDDDLFASFDGSEVSVTGWDGTSGSWTYIQDDPDSDPGIRYWAAKGGNDFTLFWLVDDSDFGEGQACNYSDPMGAQDAFTLACLTAALTITEGTYDWDTHDNNHPTDPGLSHLTLYNSINPCLLNSDDCEPPLPPPQCEPSCPELPEPNTLLILSSGLLGFYIYRRKRVS